MLPTGERLLIPQEWLSRYSTLLLMGRRKGNALLLHRSQLTDDPHASTDLPSSPASPASTSAWRFCRQSPPASLRATLRPHSCLMAEFK